MSYLKTWHPDYAAEAIKRGEKQFAERANMIFAKYVVTCGQGAALARTVAEQCGDEKTASIAGSVATVINSGNRYKKITDKQQHALAVALLERYNDARGIGAAIWGLTDADVDGADA